MPLDFFMQIIHNLVDMDTHKPVPVEGDAKPFCVLYDDGSEYSSPYPLDITPDNQENYKETLEAVARGEYSLVIFPEPSVQLLGEVGYAIYLAEKQKVDALKEKRREAGRKGAAKRKSNRKL